MFDDMRLCVAYVAGQLRALATGCNEDHDDTIGYVGPKDLNPLAEMLEKALLSHEKRVQGIVSGSEAPELVVRNPAVNASCSTVPTGLHARVDP